jgi:hypothetical protein
MKRGDEGECGPDTDKIEINGGFPSLQLMAGRRLPERFQGEFCNVQSSQIFVFLLATKRNISSLLIRQNCVVETEVHFQFFWRRTKWN